MRRISLALVGGFAGWGPVVGMDDQGGNADATSATSMTSEADSQSQSGTGATTMTTFVTTIPGDASTTEDPTSDEADWTGDDGSFLNKYDLICLTHCTPIECTLWEQDCAEDEKCVPWANDGGDTWNAHKCVPIEPEPALVGEPCVVLGNGVTGLDDCEAGAFCWGVDPYALEGECVAMCAGSEDAPVCPGGTECVMLFEDAAVTICVQSCDPLVPSCGEWEACMFTGQQTPQVPFACMPTPPFKSGNYGDVCEGDTLDTCDTGLVCVNGDLVPGCAGTECCTLLGDPAAPPVCPDPQQSCVQFERVLPDHCVCVVPE